MTEEANNYDGDACTIEKAIVDQPRGKGFRQEFPALRHLWELGVLEGSIFAPESKAWDKAKDTASVRVVVVDTPIARNQPCFEGAIYMGAAGTSPCRWKGGLLVIYAGRLIRCTPTRALTEQPLPA